jgi:hypothetical protein
MTESRDQHEPEMIDEDSPDSPVRKPDEPPTEAHGGEGAEDAGPSGEKQVHQTKRSEHEE